MDSLLWTTERVAVLRSLLDRIAKQDEHGWYLDQPLIPFVQQHGPGLGLSLTRGQVGDGIALLVGVGVLGPGKTVRAGTGYRRRYYRDVSPITLEDIRHYRRSKKAYYRLW